MGPGLPSRRSTHRDVDRRHMRRRWTKVYRNQRPWQWREHDRVTTPDSRFVPRTFCVPARGVSHPCATIHIRVYPNHSRISLAEPEERKPGSNRRARTVPLGAWSPSRGLGQISYQRFFNTCPAMRVTSPVGDAPISGLAMDMTAPGDDSVLPAT